MPAAPRRKLATIVKLFTHPFRTLPGDDLKETRLPTSDHPLPGPYLKGPREHLGNRRAGGQERSFAVEVYAVIARIGVP